MHSTTRAAVAVAAVALLAACSRAADPKCIQPSWGEIKAKCWEVRGVDTSAGVSTAKWAWDWVKKRCVPVGVDCPPTVWKLFDGKIDCLNQCKGTIGAITADPDWHHPPVTTSTARPHTAHTTTTEPYKICGTVVDVVMVLDGSGSVGDTTFYAYVRGFAADMVTKRADCRQIPLNAFVVAVVSYASSVNYPIIDFKQSENLTNDALKAKIVRDIPYVGGTTDTTGGLKKAMQLLLHTKRPARREGHDVLKAVVVITDGDPDDDINTKNMAESLRGQSITIISVGVGGVKHKSLKDMSGHSKLVVYATTQEQMKASMDKIMDKVQFCYLCMLESKDDPSVKDCSHPKCIAMMPV